MRTIALWFLSFMAIIAPERALGAGFYLYELGSPSVGLASAGYAARAQDAETLFTNPAGMTRLSGAELLASVQGLYGDISFSPSAATTVQGNSGGNAVGWLPGGSLFFVAEAIPRLKLGIGMLQYFGSALQYDPNWVGRYYAQKGVLVGLSVMPSVAYRVNEWLSIGAGLNAMYGILRNDVALNNLGASDGKLSLSNETWGFGGNVGLLFEPSPSTRFGVTWLSAVSLGFNAAPTFSGLGPGLEAALRVSGLLTSSIGLGMTLPNRVMVGVHHQLDDRWALLADIGWESWSQFGRVEVSVDAGNPTSLTKTIAYKDTWHVAAGTQFRVAEPWLLSAGVAYDTSMLDDAARTVLSPIGAQLRFALGAQWSVSKSVTLGLADTFIWGGNLPLTQDRGLLSGHVEGQYSNSLVNMLALNVRWVF